MRTRCFCRRALVPIAIVALAGAVSPAPAQPDVPPTPPRDQWYAENDTGHWSDGSAIRIDESCLSLPSDEQVACSLAAFRAKPFVVIAFVDTGINPYHHDFRAPDFVHHPSAYVDGFPDEAEALPLSFDVADAQGYHAARAADFALWSDVSAHRLYWIPGTRVIGAYSTASSPGRVSELPAAHIIDDQGHGTGVASVAAGRFYGSNPNALIVVVEGLGDAALSWATSQPWIDVVSNSWGPAANLPFGNQEPSRQATRRGQTVVFSAGNGATNTNSSALFPPSRPIPDPCKCKTPDSNPSFTDPYAGPSWVISVGAASPINGQAHWWHSIPADVSSFGSKWRAASASGVQRTDSRDFGGTSCAAPITSGVLSAVIERGRIELGDTVGGQRPGQVVATGPPAAVGPLADGALTRLEVEEIVQKTAFPVPFDAERYTWDYAVRPTTDAYYVYQGYGVIDRWSKARAVRVLLGEEPLPARDDVDAWQATFDGVRDAMWGKP